MGKRGNIISTKGERVMSRTRKDKSNLTTRQWALYKFLKDNYKEGYYISKETICTWLPEYYQIRDNETRTCRTMEEDIREINNCDLIPKIIVSNKNGYKIGNKQECEKYIKKRFIRDLKNLKLNWKLKNKVEEDGQIRFTFGKGFEREYIEAFIKELERGV